MSSKTNSNISNQLSDRHRRRFLRSLLTSSVFLLSVRHLSSPTKAASLPKDGFKSTAMFEGSANDSTDPNAVQVPYVYWTWGEITRGDCTISPGATFQLFADGSTRWKCDLRSSDSGDEWDGRFEILNQNGQVLAATPGYHFDISQENVTKHWEEFRGPNASLGAAYANASSVNFHCSC